MPVALYQCQCWFISIKHWHSWICIRAEHCSCKQSIGKIQICGAPPASGTGERGPGPPASDSNCPGKGTKPNCHLPGMASHTAAALPGYDSLCHPSPLHSFQLTPWLGCPNSQWVCWSHTQGWAAIGPVTQSTQPCPH